MDSRRLGTVMILSLVLAVLSGCVRGVQMQESSLLRLFERKQGLIAFEGLDGNIYTVDQAGKSQRSITTDATQGEAGSMTYGAPTWSFDGKHLAYVMYRTGADGAHTEAALLIGGRDGSNPRTLMRDSAHVPFYLYFAPDSRHLSVLSVLTEEPLAELGIFPVDGDGPYRVLDEGASCAWMWRGDGKALVDYIEGERISLITIDPGPVRRDLPVVPGPFQSLDLSPDGRTLLYVAGSPGSLKLVAHALEGGAETEIAATTGDFYFGYSRDGRQIAYLESFSGTELAAGTLSISTVGTTAAPVRLKDEQVLGFYWSPDSRKIAYFVPSPPQKQGDLDEAFALDENLLYVAVMIADPKSGRSWLGARFPATAGFFDNLLSFDLLQRSDTMWSPDSRYFVFGAYAADGQEALFIAAADGNLKPRFIAYGVNSSWSRR